MARGLKTNSEHSRQRSGACEGGVSAADSLGDRWGVLEKSDMADGHQGYVGITRLGSRSRFSAVGEKAKISWRDVLLPSWRSVHATPKKTVIRRRCVWGFGGRILAGCHNPGTGEGPGNLRNTGNPQTEGQLHFRRY